jgi:hypothetical protein
VSVSRRRLASLLFPLLLAGVLSGAQVADPAPPGSIDQLRVGMSARQARDHVGSPATTTRQVFYQGYLEQWIYERPEAFRLDVLYRQGRPPQVQAIHRKPRPGP